MRTTVAEDIRILREILEQYRNAVNPEPLPTRKPETRSLDELFAALPGAMICVRSAEDVSVTFRANPDGGHLLEMMNFSRGATVGVRLAVKVNRPIYRYLKEFVEGVSEEDCPP